MITQLHLENFKGHGDTSLALRPFTVLIGDNSSGKTSILEALRLPGKLAYDLSDPAVDELIRYGATDAKLSFAGSTEDHRWTTHLVIPRFKNGDCWELAIEITDTSGRFDDRAVLGGAPHFQDRDALGRMARLTGPASMYRFRADQVAASAYSEQIHAVVQEDGAQTAVALAALKLADDDAFNRIEHAMRRIVPSLLRLRIRPAELLHPSNPNPVIGSKLYFDFQGARNVPAHHASQGTLVVLALLTVLHGPDRPRVILLDDFDHALHPRTQIELVRMIKQLLALDEFSQVQIVAATHSPYVLDEVSPEDVIALSLRGDGSVASKPLSGPAGTPKVNGSVQAGEIWNLDTSRDRVR